MSDLVKEEFLPREKPRKSLTREEAQALFLFINLHDARFHANVLPVPIPEAELTLYVIILAERGTGINAPMLRSIEDYEDHLIRYPYEADTIIQFHRWRDRAEGIEHLPAARSLGYLSVG